MKTGHLQATRSSMDRDELDDLITDALLGSARHALPRNGADKRVWASVLQRAQTEVIQLPAADAPCEASSLGEAPIESPRSTSRSIRSINAGFPAGFYDAGLPYNFCAQVSHYRNLVEMKMWCSVGILQLLGNSL